MELYTTYNYNITKIFIIKIGNKNNLPIELYKKIYTFINKDIIEHLDISYYNINLYLCNNFKIINNSKKCNICDNSNICDNCNKKYIVSIENVCPNIKNGRCNLCTECFSTVAEHSVCNDCDKSECLDRHVYCEDCYNCILNDEIHIYCNKCKKCFDYDHSICKECSNCILKNNIHIKCNDCNKCIINVYSHYNCNKCKKCSIMNHTICNYCNICIEHKDNHYYCYDCNKCHYNTNNKCDIICIYCEQQHCITDVHEFCDICSKCHYYKFRFNRFEQKCKKII
jgi:hypothetical protein